MVPELPGMAPSEIAATARLAAAATATTRGLYPHRSPLDLRATRILRASPSEVNTSLEAAAMEHTFVTAQPHAHVRFRRAIERRALWLAEDAARELPNLPLEDALQLVHLYFERGSPKAEPAARRWLVRYLSEGTPSLRDVAKVTASLGERELESGGLHGYGS